MSRVGDFPFSFHSRPPSLDDFVIIVAFHQLSLLSTFPPFSSFLLCLYAFGLLPHRMFNLHLSSTICPFMFYASTSHGFESSSSFTFIIAFAHIALVLSVDTQHFSPVTATSFPHQNLIRPRLSINQPSAFQHVVSFFFTRLFTVVATIQQSSPGSNCGMTP